MSTFEHPYDHLIDLRSGEIIAILDSKGNPILEDPLIISTEYGARPRVTHIKDGFRSFLLSDSILIDTNTKFKHLYYKMKIPDKSSISDKDIENQISCSDLIPGQVVKETSLYSGVSNDTYLVIDSGIEGELNLINFRNSYNSISHHLSLSKRDGFKWVVMNDTSLLIAETLGELNV